MDAFTDFHSHEAYSTRDSIDRILVDLRAATDLAGGEAALNAVADVLEMPLACWVPDT